MIKNFLIGFVVVFVLYKGFLSFYSKIPDSDFKTPKQKAFNLEYTVGNLGGYPVKLGVGFDFMMEYNGTEIWAKTPWYQKLIPKKKKIRTYDDIIRHFNFRFRYPDGRIYVGYFQADPELKALYNKEEYKAPYPDYLNSPWVSVSVYAGEHHSTRYLDPASMERWLEPQMQPRLYPDISTEMSYLDVLVPTNQTIYGLEYFAPHPKAIEQEKGDISPFKNQEVYRFRNEKGQVEGHIECDRSPRVQNCEIFAHLQGDIKANFRIHFRKPLLPHWKEIKAQAEYLIWGLVVNPDTHEFINPRAYHKVYQAKGAKQ